jgi:hypothetical protein
MLIICFETWCAMIHRRHKSSISIQCSDCHYLTELKKTTPWQEGVVNDNHKKNKLIYNLNFSAYNRGSGIDSNQIYSFG